MQNEESKNLEKPSVIFFEISIRCKEFREDVAVRYPFGGSK